MPVYFSARKINPTRRSPICLFADFITLKATSALCLSGVSFFICIRGFAHLENITNKITYPNSLMQIHGVLIVSWFIHRRNVGNFLKKARHIVRFTCEMCFRIPKKFKKDLRFEMFINVFSPNFSLFFIMLPPPLNETKPLHYFSQTRFWRMPPFKSIHRIDISFFNTLDSDFQNIRTPSESFGTKTIWKPFFPNKVSPPILYSLLGVLLSATNSSNHPFME